MKHPSSLPNSFTDVHGPDGYLTAAELFTQTVEQSRAAYQALLKAGASLEDASLLLTRHEGTNAQIAQKLLALCIHETKGRAHDNMWDVDIEPHLVPLLNDYLGDVFYESGNADMGRVLDQFCSKLFSEEFTLGGR